jgi:hypothetical protein
MPADRILGDSIAAWLHRLMLLVVIFSSRIVVE